jgi:hypothetical protein
MYTEPSHSGAKVANTRLYVLQAIHDRAPTEEEVETALLLFAPPARQRGLRVQDLARMLLQVRGR